MKTMEKGRIEKIWENQTRKGKPYWVLSVAGERYSLFDEDAATRIREGDEIELEWRQSGQYRNVVSILPTKSNSDDGRSSRTYDRQDCITRMSCLRSASELLAYQQIPPERKLELALEYAKRFEDYVTGAEDSEPRRPGGDNPSDGTRDGNFQ